VLLVSNCLNGCYCVLTCGFVLLDCNWLIAVTELYFLDCCCWAIPERLVFLVDWCYWCTGVTGF
jgi:hypothetical protein